MAKIRLNKRSIDAIKPVDKPTVLWDDTLRGFGLTVHPSGAKKYFLYYRTADGQQRRPTIGAHGELTAKQARDIAERWRADVKYGKDPSGERQEVRKGALFSEFAKDYLTSIKKRLGKRTVEENERLLRLHILPEFGNKKVASITRADALRLQRRLSEVRPKTPTEGEKWTGTIGGPVAANRGMALLSAMMNTAEARGLRPDGSNPCRHVKLFKEQPRKRYLSPDEWGRLCEALGAAVANGLASEAAVRAILLLVFTGARRNEILTLEWKHVDLEAGRLELPTSKTGAKTVYLNSAALELLTTTPEEKRTGWVVEGRIREKRMVNLCKPWHRIRSAAGLPDVHIHDLRHAFASVAVGLGLGLPTIGALLGHHQAATTQRYAHLANDPATAANELIGEAIKHLMTAGGAEVIELNHEPGEARDKATGK